MRLWEPWGGPCFGRDVESFDPLRFPTVGGSLPPTGPEDLGQIGDRTMQSPASPDRLQALCEELATPLLRSLGRIVGGIGCPGLLEILLHLGGSCGFPLDHPCIGHRPMRGRGRLNFRPAAGRRRGSSNPVVGSRISPENPDHRNRPAPLGETPAIRGRTHTPRF